MQEITDEIIAKAAEGDSDAFEHIFKAYFGFVSHVVLRVVNRREDAEDITQEVFMTIYRNLKDFRFEANLKTWIYRIAVNSAINYSRKMSRHSQTVDYGDVRGLRIPGADVRQTLDAELNEKNIKSLLNALNPDQRACIVLKSFENLSYSEISEVLKIPINTVRSRIKRAREVMIALRKEVTKNEL